jgi:hypothetical protein
VSGIKPEGNLVEPVSAVERNASIGATIKAVGAAFFGVRGRKAHEQDVAKLNPVVVIAVGVVMAIIFVLTLLTIVQLVVRK